MQHSIRLAAGDMGRLKAIAGALGCLGTRQIGIGEPSISAMMKQVASGDLVISRGERTMENVIECESCAESGEHGVPATTRSTNPEFSGYELCAECAAEYDSRLVVTTLCAYCNHIVPEPEGDDERPPAVRDDESWAALASNHAPNCEWITTRAHRVNV